MSSLLVDVLRGARSSRRPVWIMRQAGRYLPEYRELRADRSFEQLSGDPALAAEVTLQPMRRFDLDAAIVFADLVSPVSALGLNMRFDPGPVLDTPLRTRADILALPRPDPAEAAPEVHETLRRVRAELPDDKALLGFGGAPLTLACYLVEGRGKSGFPTLRALLRSDPKTFSELLDRLTHLVSGYLIEQARAGADAVQVFDSWAGLLSVEEWREHVRPALHSMMTELERAGVPRILFLNGAPHLVEEYAALPAEALATCWRTDLGALRRRIGPDKVLQGNLDPATLLAGAETTAAATRRLLDAVPAEGHVFNLGHGILPETPIESVHALLEVVHGEQAGTS